jgi:hypothetical protein
MFGWAFEVCYKDHDFKFRDDIVKSDEGYKTQYGANVAAEKAIDELIVYYHNRTHDTNF